MVYPVTRFVIQLCLLPHSFTALYNKSLSVGIVRSEWKLSNISPVFKGGNANLVTNYRPISLISKVLERIVHNNLMHYLISNSLLLSFQFGFCHGSSTQEALLYATNDWHSYLDWGSSVSAAFFDLSRSVLLSLILAFLAHYCPGFIWYSSKFHSGSIAFFSLHEPPLSELFFSLHKSISIRILFSFCINRLISLLTSLHSNRMLMLFLHGLSLNSKKTKLMIFSLKCIPPSFPYMISTITPIVVL